ncbi:MAG: tetratricopeptide repeat protein [bacterium]|nr:tetratricopeptide repeat protein [bacterium]
MYSQKNNRLIKFTLIMAMLLMRATLIFCQDYLLVCNNNEIFEPDFVDFNKKVAYAESLVEAGQQLSAIEHYEKIVQQYPDHLKAWKRLAQLCSWNNIGEKAIGCYEKIMLLNPVDTETAKLLAQQYIWNNRQLEAIDLLERVLVLESGNLKIHRQLAQLYGTRGEAKYYRISDSNQIAREQIPLNFQYYQSSRWEYNFSVAQQRIADGRLDSTMVGYGALVGARFHFNQQTSILLRLAATHYSSNWSPFSFEWQVNQSFFNRLYTNFFYGQSETREGVRAVADKIRIQSYGAEFFWQMMKRWSLSGSIKCENYSDDNKKITAVLGSNLTLKLANPRLALYGYYSYQDFQKIYRTSFPYWTPNELETYSVGLSSEQQLFSWLNLGGGYGFANQQSIVSQNFNLKIGILVSRFSGLYLEYVKSGSEVYNAKSISLYYQHRF